MSNESVVLCTSGIMSLVLRDDSSAIGQLYALCQNEVDTLQELLATYKKLHKNYVSILMSTLCIYVT